MGLAIGWGPLAGMVMGRPVADLEMAEVHDDAATLSTSNVPIAVTHAVRLDRLMGTSCLFAPGM
jgi:hypothetical protein